MKAAVMQGPLQFEIRDVPLPVPDESQVLIRVRACAICGSDLTVYKMGVPERILGHELSGEITALGSRVSGWKKGDRVVVEPSLVCGQCHWCRQKQYNLCDALQYTGLATDGGLAEFACIPDCQLHRLPEEVSFTQGALMEPLAVARRGLLFAGIQPGQSAAVFGCGAIGLFSLLWAKHMGAEKTFAVDIAPARLAAARGLAEVCLDASTGDVSDEILNQTDGLGVDVVFECSGSPAAQLSAVNAVRKGGRIILSGIGYEAVPIALMQVTMKEITLQGSLGYSSLSGQGEFVDCLEAVRLKQIDPGRIPLHICRLEDVPSVFESLSQGSIVKAVVEP